MEFDKEKADVLLELSKKATQRFDKRKDYEWKLSFGLWLAFGSAAGLVWQADTTIPWWAFWVAVGILLLIVAAYYLLIIHWMDSSHRRDLKTSYYWESVVASMLGVQLCPALKPSMRTKAFKKWPEYPTDESEEGDAVKPWFGGKVLHALHYAGLGQLAITVLLALLLAAALFVRIEGTARDSDAGSLRLEGQLRNKVTIEKAEP